MKTLIISYSNTGNNESLATSVANELKIDHSKVKISQPFGWLVFNHIINKMPKVEPKPEEMDKYDFIILFGPVWMGRVASPLRPYFKYLKANNKKYAFISVCGGSMGENKSVRKEVEKRVGREASLILDFYITDLLSKDTKPTPQMLMDYKFNDKDLKKLTDTAIKELKKVI